jgi:hypothetical protein
MAPKTSMAAASRVAGICFGKAFVRMASAPGPPEYPRLRWATRRRFDPSSSPSATLAKATYSPRQFLGNLSPITTAISHLHAGLRLGRACLIVLRKAHLSPKLCTPRLRYGFRNSNVSKSLRISTKKILRLCSGRREHLRPIRSAEVLILPPLGRGRLRLKHCGEASVTAPAHLFGSLTRGVSGVTVSFLLCLQGRCAFKVLSRRASFGLLSFTRCLISKFSLACSLRG